MLEAAAGNNGRPLLAEKDFILTRGHTEAAPDSHITGGGNTWDTVKPLNKWFKDLSRVFLVDDDAYKVHICALISVLVVLVLCFYLRSLWWAGRS